ncbi:hypothetical protein ASE21_07520 [Flavobacterium sp. Root901]|nr:hypothetical protein ASE21_07520 [Flavobacterium sp. Root901]
MYSDCVHEQDARASGGSSVGTTLYFSPQEFTNHMSHIMNNIGQSLSKAWYVLSIIPQITPFYY